MTEEMATAMIESYTKFMERFEKAYDAGSQEDVDKWLSMASALDITIKEIGFTFKKTWDGKYVIVEGIR